MRRALFALLLPLASCRGCSDDPDAVKALSPVFGFERDENGRIVDATSTRTVRDAHLAQLRGLPRLRTLTLGEVAVTDDGLKHLSDCPKLEELTIGLCGITDAGLEHVKKLRRLRRVSIVLTPVTDAGLQRLREALPETSVNGLPPWKPR